MTQVDCGTLTDRMPDVAAGTAQWSAEDVAHLANCASCALEWQLVEAARRLGSSAARQLDSARINQGVLAAIRDTEKRSTRRRTLWLSSLATAAILLVLLRVNLAPSRPAAEPPETATQVSGAIPMAELDALDADQLEAVLEHLDAATGSMEGGGVPLMGDLDDQQLERVLRSLEG